MEAQLPEDQEKEFWKLYEQINRWVERDAALCNGQGVVHLLDWDGFSLKNYGSVGGKHGRSGSSWVTNPFLAYGSHILMLIIFVRNFQR